MNLHSTQTFQVAFDSNFRDAQGNPLYPDFDLEALNQEPGLSWNYMDLGEVVQGEDLEGYDALVLLLPRFSAESVSTDGRLSLVARFGVGYDTVDQQVCTENGIVLTNTPDAVRRPVAVSIMTLMMALTGRIFIKDRITRGGGQAWSQRSGQMGVGLVGKTLGSLGFGGIAGEMFRMASVYDMRHIAHDPFRNPEMNQDLEVKMVELEQLFSECDILCINCDLNPGTEKIVDSRLLSLMKPTAFLINTARGPIVNQKDLTEFLQQGKIAGAGLDVLEKEPPDLDDPILALENVILAPHALAWTDQLFAAIGRSVVESVLSMKNGKTPQNPVNREVLQKTLFLQKLDHYQQQLNPNS